MSITSCIFNCILRTWKEISYETINTFDLKDINVVVCSETSKGRSFQSKKFIQKSIWSKKKGRLRKFHGLHFKKKTKLDWKNALKQKSVMNSNEFDPFTGKCRKYLNSILIFTLFFIRFVRLLRNCPLDPYLISKWFVIPFGLTLFRCFLTFFFVLWKCAGYSNLVHLQNRIQHHLTKVTYETSKSKIATLKWNEMSVTRNVR